MEKARKFKKVTSKKVDHGDVSPAWKVLQMKINEEKANESPADSMETAAAGEGFTLVKSKSREKKSRKRKLQEALIEAQAAKKVNTDITVLGHDNELGEPTHVMAMDCEYVGGGIDGHDDLLARVSIVNQEGKIVYDKHIKPSTRVTDFRTFVSGIRPADLVNGITFEQAKQDVTKLLSGRIVVGHAIHNDFRVLTLSHTRNLTRDTAKCRVLKQRASWPDGKKGSPSLKMLAKEVLGIDIQKGEHDSVTDARVALRLYVAVKKKWEDEIKRFLRT